jgi:hypothetical protein
MFIASQVPDADRTQPKRATKQGRIDERPHRRKRPLLARELYLGV